MQRFTSSTHHTHRGSRHHIPMKRTRMGNYTIVLYGEVDQRPFMDIEYGGKRITVRLKHRAYFIKGNNLPGEQVTDFVAFPTIRMRGLKIDRIAVHHISNRLFIQKQSATGRLMEEIEVTPEDFKEIRV